MVEKERMVAVWDVRSGLQNADVFETFKVKFTAVKERLPQCSA